MRGRVSRPSEAHRSSQGASRNNNRKLTLGVTDLCGRETCVALVSWTQRVHQSK